MDELLRFTLIRPAEAVEGRFQIKHSAPPNTAATAATAAAAGGEVPPEHPGTLDEILGRTVFKAAHLAFNTALGDGPDHTHTAISTAAEQKYGKKPAQLVTTNEWKQDLVTLADAAIEILRAGHDKPSSGPRLLLILQGIDLVQRVAGGGAAGATGATGVRSAGARWRSHRPRSPGERRRRRPTRGSPVPVPEPRPPPGAARARPDRACTRAGAWRSR
ncbi:hypothetical protein ACIOG8_27115 [Streptomyces erythrochromogenes]|uniref:hypothetical protein n=1 Tax=Streptomyces erythrochromogenes TaxID=285574 RepID=UPI0038229C34